MREWPEFADVTCLAIACPSCMTLELARSCSSYVTTIINGADLIPTVSAGQSLFVLQNEQIIATVSAGQSLRVGIEKSCQSAGCTCSWLCKQHLAVELLCDHQSFDTLV
jgi:hypothetical protein